MKNQLRFGKWKFISFIILDLLCLIAANCIAVLLYLKNVSSVSMTGYYRVVIMMVAVDLAVTVSINSLDLVLRRGKSNELLSELKHIGFSFLALSAGLFALKQGRDYSRITVLMAYLFYFLLSILIRTVWKHILQKTAKKNGTAQKFLMTTDAFAEEGIAELKKSDIRPVGVLLLKNSDRDIIEDLSVSADIDEAIASICWNWVDCVYVYGIDYHLIHQSLSKACKEMNVEIKVIFSDFKVIDLKTTRYEEKEYGRLSFVEGKRDIPFPVRRAYWITETEAGLHRGFHAHKLNCQLLFCPYGKIDIILDNGKEKTTVCLNDPGKGMLLMPGLWREMVWKETGSVLCVLASEYYDPQEYIRDYDEFLASKGVIDEHTVC